jgi:hypothetical protein
MSIASRRKFLGMVGGMAAGIGGAGLLRPVESEACGCRPLHGRGRRGPVQIYAKCVDAKSNDWNQANQWFQIGSVYDLTFDGVFQPARTYTLSTYVHSESTDWIAPDPGTPSSYGPVRLNGVWILAYRVLTFRVEIRPRYVKLLVDDLLDFTITSTLVPPYNCVMNDLIDQPVHYLPAGGSPVGLIRGR